jgi:2-polyprenyl-3-methyl-5-hydroxy-6-metoxy-1,4-benzoquinol methylase
MTKELDSQYVYDQRWELERARLDSLSAAFDTTTIRHLTAAGVSVGWHCLEVGAGAGSVARWLAASVGATGRLVATDLDTRFLDDLGGPPVEVMRHDVTSDPIEQHAFHLVHARAVVEHVRDRASVIARLVQALRPGGVLVVEDVVFGGTATQNWEPITSPSTAAHALSRAMNGVAGAFRATGTDPEFGLQLPSALRAAGLHNVAAELIHQSVQGGSPEAAFYELSLRHLGPRLIDAGLIAAQDVEDIVALLKDPNACWLSIGMVSVSGRAPLAGHILS